MVLLVVSTIVLSCIEQHPNQTENGNAELQSLEMKEPVNKGEIEFNDTIYVPIYSDIYFDETNQKDLLSATLSIRNTSYSDTLYISKIDYFNTEGSLVKKYLENAISLNPMATINYVIEKKDDTGGSGANFIIVLHAKNPRMLPLIQAIMIGHNGNKGYSFTTEGHSIREK